MLLSNGLDSSIEVLGHLASHVDAGGSLDALQSGTRVDLEDQRPPRGLEHVHACEVEPQCLSRLFGNLPLPLSELDLVDRATKVEVRAELAAVRLSTHRGDDLPTNDEGTDVLPVGLLDVLLDQRPHSTLQHLVHQLPGLLFGVH